MLKSKSLCRLIVFIFLKICFINTKFSDRLCSEIYPKDAKNIILVYNEFHEQYNPIIGFGEVFLPSALTEAIQIYASIDYMNKNSVNKNFTFGVRLCDTCQNENIVEILTTENLMQLNGKLIAVLASVTSSSFIRLSNFIRKYNQNLPIIAYASTSSTLMNSKSDQIMQLVPVDTNQAKALQELLITKDCNYATVIGNNNTYSSDLKNDFHQFLQPYNINRTICINKNVTINSNSETQELVAQLKDLLQLYQEDETIPIIYLGYREELINIINTFNDLIKDADKSVAILTSEAAINDFFSKLSIDHAKIKVYSIQLKSISVKQHSDLVIYYTQLLNPLIKNLNNSEYRYAIYEKLPWLLEFIMNTLGCRFDDLSIELFQRDEYSLLPFCNSTYLNSLSATSALSLVDSQYLRYLIYSLAALKNSFYEEIKSINNTDGYFSDFSIKNIKTKLRNTTLDLRADDMVPFEIRGLFSVVNGRISVNKFDIYGLLSLFDSLPIGYFQENRWNFIDLKEYSLEKCKCQHLCSECLKKPEIVIHPGDLYLIVVVSLNFNSNNKICSTITGDRAYLWWQNLLYKMSIINQNISFGFPNGFKIGTIMMNDCYLREMAYSKLLMLKESYPEYFSKRIGVIGGTSSDTTKSIIRFNKQSVMTVSSVASAVSLNNEENFCRTIPDDTQQATVMIEILKKMNWTCVIGLYKNSEYGINGDKVLKLLTEKNDINYQSQVIDDLKEAKRFVEQTETDIVLIFSDLQSIKLYFDYLKQTDSRVKKVYIMGDTWTPSLLEQNSKYFLGSFAISFGKPSTADSDFDQYLVNKYKTILNNNESYFTDDHFDHSFECSRPNSLSNFIKPYVQCSLNEIDEKFKTFLNLFKKIDATRFNYVNTALAFLTSYGEHINKTCKTKFANQTEFIDCLLSARTPNVMRSYLRKVILDEDALGNKNVKIFDNDTCNGYDLPYTINHIYGSISRPTFMNFATYQPSSRQFTGFDPLNVKVYSIDGTELYVTQIQATCQTVDELDRERVKKCQRNLDNKKYIILAVSLFFVFIWVVLIAMLFQFRKWIVVYSAEITRLRAPPGTYATLNASTFTNIQPADLIDTEDRNRRNMLPNLANNDYMAF